VNWREAKQIGKMVLPQWKLKDLLWQINIVRQTFHHSQNESGNSPIGSALSQIDQEFIARLAVSDN
jgi:hypothetical protein